MVFHGGNSFKEEFVQYLTPFKMLVVILDADKTGDNLLKCITESLGEDARRLFFVPMPHGVKDINTFHCMNCGKDIGKFAKEFHKLAPIPATMEAFELYHQEAKKQNKTAYLITEYNIDNYIKHVIGDNKIEIDRFIDRLYKLQGKECGITKTTIKDVAKSATIAMVRESEEAQEELMATLGDKIIVKNDDCYAYKRITPQGIALEPFTSFTIKVIRREEQDNGEVIAVWQLHNDKGKTMEIEVGAKERASSTEFMQKVGMKDGFMYRVPPISGFHNMFMYYIECDVNCPVLKKCNCIGKYNDVWLFDEYGMDKNGGVVFQNNGSYNLDGINYMPPVSSMPKELYRAKVNMQPPTAIDNKYVIELLDLLARNQGTRIAWVILGWIGACFAKDKVQELGWGFPVCYVTGNAQSGKTTLAKWLMKTAGFMNVSALGAKSSIFGINMLSSAYSNLPLWFDDIRSLGEEGIWNSIILGAYENSGDIKGSKDRTLATTLEYKSGVLITSEFFVKSPAAQSRCLQLVVDSNLQDKSLFGAVDRAVSTVLPVIGANMIQKIQADTGNFQQSLHKYRDLLVKNEVNARFAQNYAVVLAGFDAMFGDYLASNPEIMEKFMNFILALSIENDEDVNSNSYALELVKDIGNILQDRMYSDLYKNGEEWIVRENKLYLKSSSLYDIWRRYKGMNNVGDYNNRREFVAQLRRLQFAIRNSNGTATINGKKVTVICLDLDMMAKHKDTEINTLPDIIKSLDTSEFI